LTRSLDNQICRISRASINRISIIIKLFHQAVFKIYISTMAHIPKYKEMTTSSRQAAFCTLHSHAKVGVLERGWMAKTARMFSVHHSTMTRLWREISAKIADKNLAVADVLNNPAFFENKRKQTGRHPKWDREELREALREIPTPQRKSIRSLAIAMGVPKSTLHGMVKTEGTFKAPTKKASTK
jgi:hypothetical protein